MMSGDGLNSTVPPSPTKAIFPRLRVARIAVARAAAFAEQSKARRLSLDAALRVLVTAFRSSVYAWLLRADEELARTVAYASYSDGRMNFE